MVLAARAAAFFLVASLLIPLVHAQGVLQFADLGDFPLESGEVIRDCKIGYRTFGELDADKSNAVLFPTWFSGQSKDLVQFMDPDAMVDTSEFFVIAVDALGNGISSSPSNSQQQPGGAFPKFSIGDMVNSQHRLLTQVLGIRHLHAVMGISMGAMQTFRWIIAYPGFMDRAVPIVGSPRLGSYDLQLWNAELHAIEEILRHQPDLDKARASAMKLVSDIHQLALTSPERFNSDFPRGQIKRKMATDEAELIQRVNHYDWAGQLRAMIGHDVSEAFGGNLARAAASVQAEMLVISALEDHMVTPGPSLDFAERIGARTLELDGNCGHLFALCHSQEVEKAVREFLAE